MPTETEELRLVITLTDNASAGLRALKQQHAELGSGATAGHVESFKKKHNELAKQIKEMTELATGGERAMLGFIGKFGVAGAAVVGFTAVVLKGLEGLTKYADKVTDLNNKAKVMGVHPAVLKSIEEQLERIGISAETADQTVAKFNEKFALMGRVGSREHQELVNKAGRSSEAMEQSIQKILNQKTEVARLNEVLAQGEIVKANYLKDHNNNIVAATQFHKEFLAEWGIDPEFALVGKLKDVSEEEMATWDKRQKAALQFKAGIVDLKHEWADFMDDVKSSVLAPDGLIVTGLHEAITLTKFLHELWEKPLTKQVAQGTWDAMKFMIPGVNTILLYKNLGKLSDYLSGKTQQTSQKNMGDALGLDALGGPAKPGEEGKATHLLSMMGDDAEEHKRSTQENTAELKKLNDYFTRQQLEEEAYTGAGYMTGAGPGAPTGAPTSGPGGGLAAPGGGPAAPGGGPAPAGLPSVPGAAPGAAGGFPMGGAAQKAAEKSFGLPSFGTEGRGTLKGELGLDAFTRGAPARGVLGAGAEGAAAQLDEGNKTLAEQRAPYIKYLNEHPDVKAKMAGLLVSEEPSREGRTGTAETLLNRMISHKIPPEQMATSVEGLASGRGVYYEPLRPGGTYGRSAAELARNPQLMKETLADIDRAATSNISNYGTQNASLGVAERARRLQTITKEGQQGISDTWSRKDVHPEEHGALTVAREKEWYERTKAAEAGDRAMVDKRSIKTVKVDAQGKVAVNIGGGGNDATLGSTGLFKSTTPERQAQMEPAKVGPDAPATFNERFTGKKTGTDD
jgi:hypothetical protein